MTSKAAPTRASPFIANFLGPLRTFMQGSASSTPELFNELKEAVMHSWGWMLGWPTWPGGGCHVRSICNTSCWNDRNSQKVRSVAKEDAEGVWHIVISLLWAICWSIGSTRRRSGSDHIRHVQDMLAGIQLHAEMSERRLMVLGWQLKLDSIDFGKQIEMIGVDPNTTANYTKLLQATTMDEVATAVESGFWFVDQWEVCWLSTYCD